MRAASPPRPLALPERQHEILTPEGVPLRFTIARAGDRLGAFLLDAVLILVASVTLLVAAASATGWSERGGWLWAFVYLGVFLLQGFYFIWFESRGQGMTPGKRRMGIRVMEAEGGALGAGAIVVRNVMRILEVQLPLVAIAAPESLWPGAPPWMRLPAMLWLVIVAGMPLFNRRRLRVGDMVAGTVVVAAPSLRLEGDVVAAPEAHRRSAAPEYAFGEAQLDVYGAYELQVLEDVLRRPPGARETLDVQWAVADRIARKIRIGRRLGRREAHAFLSAFYAALRARLEQRMLFGKRKKDKFSDEE